MSLNVHEQFVIVPRLVAIVCAVLLGICSVAQAQYPVQQDLLPENPEELWETTNSSVKSVTKDGETVYRWHLKAGQKASLAIKQGHPLLGQLRYYDFARFQFRIASGELSEMHLRALGHVSGPRQYKVHSYNVGIRTTAAGRWHRRMREFVRPNWFPWDNPDGPKDKVFFKFNAVSLGPDTVIEIRGLSLNRAMIRLKPDFLAPVTWPRLQRQEDGSATYTFTHHLLNQASQPLDIRAEVLSEHDRFDVTVSPGRKVKKSSGREATVGDVKNGKKVQFTIRVRMDSSSIQETDDLYSENLVVAFRPVGEPEAEIIWQDHMTRPLSADVRRQVLLEPEQIETIRRGMADGDERLKKLLDARTILGTADEFVEKKLLRIPTGHGHPANNWIGPWRPADRMPEAVNTKTGVKKFDTETAAKTWKEYMAHRGKALRRMAYAYLFTGEEKYAEQAIELFQLYADTYADLSWNNMFGAPWGRGPVIRASTRTAASSTYGSNWYFKGHCLLLSAIADSPSWSPEARRRVYRRFVVPYVTEVKKFHGGITNMTDITNKNVLLLGLAFRDANMVRWALRSDPGLLRRLEDITPGGFSSEGRPVNYHYAAMTEYVPALAYLDNAGLATDFPRKRVLTAVTMPYRRATLNGLVPNTGDCGRGLQVRRTQLADYLVGMFPEEDWLFDLGRTSTVSAQLKAYREERRPDPDRWRELLETEPRLFREAGYAILREGEEPENQVMVTLDYGRNPMHAHLDRNQVTLSAFGRIFSQGPGSLYNVGSGGMERNRNPKLESFCSHGSLGQNVIMVDQTDQLKAVGELLAWHNGPDYQAVAARVPSIRPGVDHVRAVLLRDGVVVILDRVTGDEPHTYDFLYHNLGELKLEGGWSAKKLDNPLGNTGNYGNLIDPQRLEGQGPVRLQWQRAEGVTLALWHVGAPDATPYMAVTGMNNYNSREKIIPDRAPTLISRTQGKTAHYLTVLDPYREQPAVTDVERLGAETIRIHFRTGETWQVALDQVLQEGR